MFSCNAIEPPPADGGGHVRTFRTATCEQIEKVNKITLMLQLDSLSQRILTQMCRLRSNDDSCSFE